MFLFYAIDYLKYLIDRIAKSVIYDTQGFNDHMVKLIQACIGLLNIDLSFQIPHIETYRT
jgi:hypothetical protein